MSVLVALLLSVQDAPVLKPEENPRKMLYTFLTAEAGKEFDARRKEIAALKTPVDVARRQQRLREKFIEAIGGFPEKTPLNARVAGKAERDGYRIEKVVYESRAGHHVTAVLYLPDARGPVPGILFPCGHSDEGKGYPEYQRACILLAKNGFAVLCFDPISQGERVQKVRADGKPAVGRGTMEHTVAGVAALLVGQCTASYEIWDGIRSIDYLASRPEVDPKRLGCLGNSGGGTQTAYLMALDERIACAVPNCFITSLERLFATIGPQDAEQNIPGQVAFGMEHADYLFLRAPRPTQISATTRDFFDIQGSWTTFREAKLLYGMLGHGERVDLFEFNDPHALSKPMRQAALRWFRRWLMGVDDAPVETESPIAKDPELWCTTSGNAVPELNGKTVFDFIAAEEERLAAGRGSLEKKALLQEVRRLASVGSFTEGAVQLEPRGVVDRAGDKVHLTAVDLGSGVKLPVRYHLCGPVGQHEAIVVVHAEGKLPDGVLERLAKESPCVHVLEPRGWGETSPGPAKGNWEKSFGPDWKESFLGIHLARPLLGQRVVDVVKMTRRIAVDSKKKVVALGAAGPVVLHAAALDPDFPPVELDGMVISWSAVAKSSTAMNQLTNVVPGALRVYDLPDLAASMAPRPLTIRNPVDPSGKPVPQAELDAAYARARAAYKAAGAEKNLVLQAAP